MSMQVVFLLFSAAFMPSFTIQHERRPALKITLEQYAGCELIIRIEFGLIHSSTHSS